MVAGNATRNSLMNEPVITLDDRDPLRTDILHEYFIGPARFAEFVKACQDVIPASYQQLLNITLRYVNTDNDSVLAYATEPRIAAVMLFSQEQTVRGESDMARMTRDLIERVLAMAAPTTCPTGRATLDQLSRGYPSRRGICRAPSDVDRDRCFAIISGTRIYRVCDARGPPEENSARLRSST